MNQREAFEAWYHVMIQHTKMFDRLFEGCHTDMDGDARRMSLRQAHEAGWRGAMKAIRQVARDDWGRETSLMDEAHFDDLG